MKDPVAMDTETYLRKSEKELEIRERAERLAEADMKDPDPDMMKEAIDSMPPETLKDFCLAMGAEDDTTVGRMLRRYTYAQTLRYAEDGEWAEENEEI